MKNEKYLHQFRVVAEHQSISTACNELHITQSALTKNIKKIEERFGVQLFERLARGMSLTPYGEILFERVKKMELEFSYALNDIANLRAGRGERLKVGCELMWGEVVLPEVISEMYNLYPMAEIDIVSGSVLELANDLSEGKIDLLLGNMEYMFHEQDQVECISVAKTRGVVVVDKEHPLANFEQITPSDLVNYNWVLYHQWKQASRQVNRYCMCNGLSSAKISLKSCYFTMIRKMMTDKNCLLFSYNHLEAMHKQNGLVVLPLTVPFAEFDTGIWGTRPSLESRIAKSFIDKVKLHITRHKKCFC